MKIGRNEFCPCGSGKKYKKCCLGKDSVVISVESDEALLNTSRFNGGINLMPYVISKFAEDKSLLKKRRNKHLRDMWTPLKVRKLSTKEIIQKITSAGISFDESEFLAECKNHKCAWDVSKLWTVQVDSKLSIEMDDFVGLAACILWERLNSSKVSYEMLDDMMQKGYELKDSRDICEVWWKAWCTFKELFDLNTMSIDDVDSDFPGSQSLHNWSQDFQTALLNAAFRDKKHAKLGVKYCSEFLKFFGAENDMIVKNVMGDLAEMYALAGDQKKGEKMMNDLILKEPNKARGYATLARVISYRERNGGEFSFDEQLQILEDAKAYPVDDGEDYSLSQWIADLKKMKRE